MLIQTMRMLFLIFVSLMLFGFFKTNPSPEQCKIKAKRIADSIIYKFIDKDVFEKYYKFDNKCSSLKVQEKNYIEWKKKLSGIPHQYTLSYDLLKTPTIATDGMAIILDSNFSIISIENLINPNYLKPFINKKQLEAVKVKNGFAFNSRDFIFYDTIPGEITVKPYFVISKYIRTYSDNTCIHNIDTCLAIDPYDGHILKWFNSFISECF
jgi:hypothetical protein